MIKRLLILLTAVSLILALCACGSTRDAVKKVNDEKTAPNFTVYTEDGKAVKLSDFFGKPIVINFWASWCGPCRDEMPHFEEAYETLGRSVQFIMINLDPSKEDAKEFLTENGYDFPVYYDSYSEASTKYGVSSIPTTVFIDRDGHIDSKGVGNLSKEALMDGIEDIME